jgi:hypothetical protein
MWIFLSFALSSRTLVPVKRFIYVTSSNIWPSQVANTTSSLQWMECLLRAFGVFPSGLLSVSVTLRNGWPQQVARLTSDFCWKEICRQFFPIFMYCHCTVSDLKLNAFWFTACVQYIRNTSAYIYIYIYIYIHLLVCLTTGPKPLPKQAVHIVRSRAFSFKWQYLLLSSRSS